MNFLKGRSLAAQFKVAALVPTAVPGTSDVCTLNETLADPECGLRILNVALQAATTEFSETACKEIQAVHSEGDQPWVFF